MREGVIGCGTRLQGISSSSGDRALTKPELHKVCVAIEPSLIPHFGHNSVRSYFDRKVVAYGPYPTVLPHL